MDQGTDEYKTRMKLVAANILLDSTLHLRCFEVPQQKFSTAKVYYLIRILDKCLQVKPKMRKTPMTITVSPR